MRMGNLGFVEVSFNLRRVMGRIGLVDDTGTLRNQIEEHRPLALV